MSSYLITLFLLFTLVSCGSASTKTPSNNPVISSRASSSSTASTSSAMSSLSISSKSSSSSSTASSVSNTEFYGMYVSLNLGYANQLIGNSLREEKFIRFVKDNGFTYLIFYELEGMAPTSLRAQQFASLVKRLKETAGVTEVAAALGDAGEADTVVAYNKAHTASERIDVLNVEYEFWNKPDRKTAFSNTVSMLERFMSVGKANQLKTEIYVGWMDATEAKTLAHVTDRILIHYYVKSDTGIINYGIERLEALASAGHKVNIAPIFSNEGPKNTADIPFMGCWLEKNTHQQAFASWKAQYAALNKPWQENLQVVGGTWFIYDKFLDIHQYGGAAPTGCDNL